jgi:hypothetical protein
MPLSQNHTREAFAENRIGFLTWGDLSNQVAATVRYEPTEGAVVQVLFGRDRERGGHTEPESPAYRELWRSSTLPDPLYFYDHQGMATLTRCRHVHRRYDLIGATEGLLTLRFEMLVTGEFDSEIEPSEASGLRSRLAGLDVWAGLASHSERRETSSDGRVRAMEFRYQSVDPEKIAVGSNTMLMLAPTWAGGSDGAARTVMEEWTWITTESKTPRDFAEHLTIHRRIRDLLMLSSGRRFDFTQQQMRHQALPDLTLSGAVIGEGWREVLLAQDSESVLVLPRGSDGFLLLYSDIGVKGLRRWLKIREAYGRVFDPALLSLSQSRSPIPT